MTGTREFSNRILTEVPITGFTEDEAKRFSDNKGFKFEEIQGLSGTNPLLLSLLPYNMDINWYAARVRSEVNSFLERNLGIKGTSQESVEVIGKFER